MIAGSLEIQLFANIARLQKDMDDAKRSVGGAMGAIENAVGGAIKVFGLLGGVLSVGAFFQMAKGAIDAADAVSKLSQRTGVATEALSQLQYAFKLGGVEGDSLTKGIKKLNVSIAEGLAGDKEKTALFKSLGVTLKDTEGKTKSADKVLLEIADSFSQAKDGASKTAIAVGLLGKAGDEMIPALNGGSRAIVEMMNQADKLGLTISTEFGRQAEEFNDNLSRIKTTSQALSISIGSELVKSLSHMLELLTEAKLQSDNVHRSFAEMFAGGVKTTIETVAVLLANVLYVIRSIGIEIGGMAAQAAALATGDISGFMAIGQAMKEDAARARTEVDKLSASIIGVREEVVKTAGEFARLDRVIPGKKTELKYSKGDDSAAKALEKELKEQAKLLAELSGLSGSFAEDWERLNKVYGKGVITVDQLTAAQAELLSKQPFFQKEQHKTEESIKALIAQWEEEAKAIAKAAEEYDKLYTEQDKSATSMAAEVQAQREYNKRIGLTTEAVAALDAVKLQEQATAKDRLATLADEIDWTGALGDAYRAQAQALRDLADLKVQGAFSQKQIDEFKSVWESVDRTAQQTFTNIFDGGQDAFTKLRDTLKSTLLDLLYQMTVRKWIFNIVASVSGSSGSAISSVANASGLNTGLSGLLSNGSSLYSIGSQVFGGSISLGNAAGTLYGNATGTGLNGLLASNGAYGTAAGGSGGAAAAGGIGAGLASAGAIAIIVSAAIDMYKDSKGEKRSGAAYGYDPTTGRTNFITGPSGGDPDSQANQLLVGGIGAGINDALRALGSRVTLTGFQAAYETSQVGRGGVYAGGTLSNGMRFGESGQGTNYDWTSPLDSLYEQWNNELDPTMLRLTGQQIRNNDLSGSPQELAIDAQQAFIEAIQASFGLIPRIVAEQYTVMGGVSNGQYGENNVMNLGEITATRWLRVYDQATKDAIRAAGEMPKRIMDLILDVDPESLSAEATTELTNKISTLVSNVNGFRAIVEPLPVTIAALRDASFDYAAALVEQAGGLDAFNASITTFANEYYSDAEKTAKLTGVLTTKFQELGYTLPTTREEFRAMVEASMALGEAGAPTTAALLGLGGALAQILPPIGSVTSALAGMNAAATSYFAAVDAQTLAANLSNEATAGIDKFIGSTIQSVADAQASQAQAALNAAREAANLWRQAQSSIESALSAVRGGTLDLQPAYLRRSTTLGSLDAATIAALGGDAASAANVGALAQQFLAASKSSSVDRISYLRDRAMAESKLVSVLDKTKAQVTLQEAIASASEATVSQLQIINQTLTGFGAQVFELLSKGYAGADRETATTAAEKLAKATSDFAYFFNTTKEGDVITGGQWGSSKITRLAGDMASFTSSSGVVSYLRAADTIIGLGKQSPELRAIWEQQYGFKLPAFEMGTPYVPHDMIAQIHRGEAIMPAPTAQRWRDSGDGETADAMRDLVEEISRMRKNSDDDTKRIYQLERIIDNWDRNGAPVRNQTGTTLEVTS